jgi:hypothetical protein
MDSKVGYNCPRSTRYLHILSLHIDVSCRSYLTPNSDRSIPEVDDVHTQSQFFTYNSVRTQSQFLTRNSLVDAWRRWLGFPPGSPQERLRRKRSSRLAPSFLTYFLHDHFLFTILFFCPLALFSQFRHYQNHIGKHGWYRTKPYILSYFFMIKGFWIYYTSFLIIRTTKWLINFSLSLEPSRLIFC